MTSKHTMKSRISVFMAIKDKLMGFSCGFYGIFIFKQLVVPLPVGGFEWMTKDEKQNWKNVPCILEVDLEYPIELHDLHNDYPLAPERIKVDKVEKLIPNLYDKEKYIVHHLNLKQYEKLGLKIKKIRRGIKFREEPWMKSYIELNT